jgi:hypothetical protein
MDLNMEFSIGCESDWINNHLSDHCPIFVDLDFT